MVKFVMTVFLVAAMAGTTPTAVVDAMNSQTTGSEILTTLTSESSTQSDAPRTPSRILKGLRRKLRSCRSPSASQCRRWQGGWEAEGKRVGRLEGKEHTLKNLVVCTKPENADLDGFSGELSSMWAVGQDQPLTCSQGPGKVTLQCNQHGGAYGIIDDCTRHSCDTENVEDGDNCFCGGGTEHICTKKQCTDNGNTCPEFIRCLLGKFSTWDPRTYSSGADIKSAGICHKNKDVQECVDECASCADKTGTDLKDCMETDGTDWSGEMYDNCFKITGRTSQGQLGYTCNGYGGQYPQLLVCCPEQPYCNQCTR